MPHKTTRITSAWCLGEFRSRSSGLVTLIDGFSAGLGKLNTTVKCYIAGSSDETPSKITVSTPNQIIRYSSKRMKNLNWCPDMKRGLMNDHSQINVLHNHCCWVMPSHYASTISRQKQIPLLFSAHGALEPWSMARNGRRKRLMWNLYQKKDILNANCIHVSAQSEIRNIRKLGIKNPIVVIPNGVNALPSITTEKANAFRKRLPNLKDKKAVVFLSRIHEKKGVRHLIQAWASIKTKAKFKDWHLIIAGPDDGFLKAAKQMTKSLALESHISFPGALYSDEKAAAFACAEFFVLPSFAEGLPLAVLEAMASSLPVLISKQCNFANTDQFGLQILPNAESTTDGLQKMMSLSIQERKEMGGNSRLIVRQKYSWDTMSKRLEDVYSWLIHGGSKPNTCEWDTTT